MNNLSMTVYEVSLFALLGIAFFLTVRRHSQGRKPGLRSRIQSYLKRRMRIAFPKDSLARR